MGKATLVIGASTNPDRYSYMAVRSLIVHQHEVYAVGLRRGLVHGVQIQRPFPELPPINTVTLYVGRENQPFYYDFIGKVRPARVIFNPGTENEELASMLETQGIEVLHGCTLVMLMQGTY